MIFRGLRPCLVVNPIPCIPFPLGISEGEGEDLERGAAPLSDAPLERWGIKGGFKGGFASLPYPSPSPLKERGIKKEVD